MQLKQVLKYCSKVEDGSALCITGFSEYVAKKMI
jgi:hypothetical protein